MKYIVYHGTGNSFRKFNIKKTTQGLFWFTDDKEAILSKEVGAQGHGYIYKCEVEINNPCGWKEYERLVQGQIESMGYDGIILPDGEDGTTYIVFEPSQIKILEKEKLTEAVEKEKKITITARDSEDTLEDLLNAIKKIGNSGHSFDILVDPKADYNKNPNHKDGPIFNWDGDGNDFIKSIIVEAEWNQKAYLSWKRKNVTIRGIKDRYAEDNGNGAMMGQGLYTAFLSNKKMAKKYGELYFLLNAIPKKPLILNTLNDWEIWEQKNLYKNYGYDQRKFFADGKTIKDEMIKRGYDGVIIKGREMVNYTPPDNVKYFQNEKQLIQYYKDFVEKNELNEPQDTTEDFNKNVKVPAFPISEDITLDIDKGDTIKTGKFLNKRVVVKDISKDEHGMPIINNRKIMSIRIPKMEPQKESLVIKILKENSFNVKKRI